MSSPVYCWLLISLLVFKGCQSLFLRHTKSGKCIAVSEELVYDDHPDYSLPYFVVMDDNCLNDTAQFRYLDSQLLHNIEKEGTLVSPHTIDFRYKSRWAVFKGVATGGKNYQNHTIHRLKQTDAGSLLFYNRNDPACAEPDSKYLLRKTSCGQTKQKFTFGSVTAYNAEMENVHCSLIQHMMVESADYGDYNSGTFNKNANIDTQCSKLTNCQVKSLCGGQRSCELTMDNNLLPSKYCSDTSKQIYTKYTCVDTYSSSAITTATNIRLTNQKEGYIEIKNGSIWRKVVDENWDGKRQEMLCQHLGFEEIGGNGIQNVHLTSGELIATGDLICYNTQPNETSCCVHLEPSISTTTSSFPNVTCKICSNPLLHDANAFPDSVFSGSGGSGDEYKDARITKDGWCPSGSGSRYLLIDHQREYHITGVVVMADKGQTKWSDSYSLKYSHDTSYQNTVQIRGNQNSYQASRTSLDIYNVRYVKIESTGNQDFCLRLELCGEDQTPAPVSDITVSPSQYSARVAWKISTSIQDSSYITQIIMYLNNKEHKTISRRNQVTIDGLSPNSSYTVGIQTQDGSLRKSQIVIKTFMTNEKGGALQECDAGKIRLDLLIPLVIFVLCFLLLLGIIIYQRRLIRNNNKQPDCNYETPKQAHRKDTEGHILTMKAVKAAPEGLYVNDDDEYESPDNVVRSTERNKTETQPEISTGQDSSTYMSLKDKREPGNVYQSLQQPNIQTVEYENPAFTSNKGTK